MKTMHQITPDPIDSKDKTNKESAGFGLPGQKLVSLVWAGGRESHASDTPLIVGAFSFASNDHEIGATTLSVLFRAVAANGVSPLTTHVKLVNVTDGEDVATLNFVDTTSTGKQEAALVLGSGVGEIKPTERVYEIQIFVDAPSGPDDTIELNSVELRVVNTVD